MFKKVSSLFLVIISAFWVSCASTAGAGQVYEHPVEVQTAGSEDLAVSYQKLTKGPSVSGTFLKPIGHNIYDSLDIYGNFVSDAQKKNIKGPVKKITLKVYSASGEVGEKVKGDLELRYCMTKKYDAAGNLYESIVPSDSDDFEIGSTTVYEHYYDLAGRCVSYDTGDTGGTEYRHVFDYDEQNRIIKKTFYRNRELQTDYKPAVYTYDSESGLITGEGSQVFSFEALEGGGLGLTVSLKDEIKDIFIYDDAGRLIEESESFSDSIILNRQASSFKTKSFSGVKTRVYVRDEQGNVIQKQESSVGGKISMKQKEDIEYSYEYSDFDEYGNWLSYIDYKNGEITYFNEREIEYYE